MVEVEDRKVVVANAVVTNFKPFVVVGIPAFNEEKTIAHVVLRAQDYADKVVVCDDGSTDLTAEIAEKLGAEVTRHEQNLGYGAAVQSLFKVAKELDADVLVTLDADGQHDPKEIPVVSKPIVDGSADVVIGSRLIDRKTASTMPWYRRTGVKFITKLTNGNSSQNSVRDGQSGFRAYGRKAISELVIFENGMGVSAEILLNARKQGLKVAEVASSCTYGNGVKTSTHNPVRHGFSVIGSVVKLVVEDKPLTALGLPGMACLVAGAFFGAWMLQIYAEKKLIETNVALATIGFLMVGFFCLSTAITLFAISRLAEKTNGKR